MYHECIIGMIYDYDSTRLVTVESLKTHIAQELRLAELMEADTGKPRKVYSLADYCDGRRRTDLVRFAFCPLCGQYIDWRGIKEGRYNGTTD